MDVRLPLLQLAKATLRDPSGIQKLLLDALAARCDCTGGEGQQHQSLGGTRRVRPPPGIDFRAYSGTCVPAELIRTRADVPSCCLIVQIVHGARVHYLRA